MDFERTEKYVVTDNGYVEPYDHLVITAGRQYTVPKELSPPKYLARNGVFPLGSKLMIDKLMQHVREVPLPFAPPPPPVRLVCIPLPLAQLCNRNAHPTEART